jgi:hypothetical protein
MSPGTSFRAESFFLVPALRLGRAAKENCMSGETYDVIVNRGTARSARTSPTAW